MQVKEKNKFIILFNKLSKLKFKWTKVKDKYNKLQKI